MTGTTPKTQAIGAELRRAREDAGLSARQLAIKLGKAHTTITRWEAGDRAPRPVDVATVLSALGVRNALREALVEIARDPDERHWTAESLPEQQLLNTNLLEQERESARITMVSPLLVPGILQIAEYTRAMMTTADIPRGEIEMKVAARISRRDVLFRANPAQLFAITSEFVLEQAIGTPEVMVEQLRALLFYADLPNVDLRVVPTRTGWHPGLEGPFSIKEFTGRPPIVSLEHRHGCQFFHGVDEVTAYRNAAMKVTEAALDQVESAALIAEILHQTEKS